MRTQVFILLSINKSSPLLYGVKGGGFVWLFRAASGMGWDGGDPFIMNKTIKINGPYVFCGYVK